MTESRPAGLTSQAAGHAATGDAFFAFLATYLCRTLDMEIALVARLTDESGKSVETLAMVIDDKLVPNVVYPLAGTPCSQVFGRKVCTYPREVADLFPQDAMLRELGAVSYVGSPLFDSTGRPTGIIAVLGRKPLDRLEGASAILQAFAARASAELERKQVLDDLRMRESFYRSVLESSFEGICAIDSRGICTLLSSRAAQILGYDEGELIGRNFHEVIHPAGQCGTNCWMTRFDAEKVRHNGEDVFINKSGRGVPVQFAASLIQGSVANGIVLSFLELTERRQLEAQLEQARRIHGLGQLATSVAHEFNNVLMGIQPFAEMVARRASDQSELASAAAHISQSVTRGKRVTEEILRFARPSSPVLKPLAVQPMLQHLRKELEQILGKRITLELEVNEGSLYLLGDVAQLGQVMVNLANNARDAMPNGGTLRITAEAGRSDYSVFPVQSPDSYVYIRVADTGVGISPDVLEHIFEPLYTTKMAGRGAGLGLAITHQIVRLHRGLIFTESQLGKGSTFHLFIPASLPPMHESEPMEIPLPPQRLLLVEDEASIAEGLTSLLEADAHDVRVVNEGGRAIAAIESFSPTALILDVGLPDIDGFQLYEQIAARWPNLPVVFSTGHGDQTHMQRYEDRPHVGFLLKPYESETLSGVLAEVLGYKSRASR